MTQHEQCQLRCSLIILSIFMQFIYAKYLYDTAETKLGEAELTGTLHWGDRNHTAIGFLSIFHPRLSVRIAAPENGCMISPMHRLISWNIQTNMKCIAAGYSSRGHGLHETDTRISVMWSHSCPNLIKATGRGSVNSQHSAWSQRTERTCVNAYMNAWVIKCFIKILSLLLGWHHSWLDKERLSW